jgi:hypothetical protein
LREEEPVKKGWFVTAIVIVQGAIACKGEQELKDDCPHSNGACPACSSDNDCVIVSNPCHETASCTHRNRNPPLSVDQIGCSTEYDKPPANRCGCVQNVCRGR